MVETTLPCWWYLGLGVCISIKLNMHTTQHTVLLQSAEQNQVRVLWAFLYWLSYLVALTLLKPNFAVGNCLEGIHFEGYVFNNKIRPTESHLLLLNSGDSSTMPNYAVNTAPPSTLQTTLVQDCDMSLLPTRLYSLISFWLLLPL